MSTHRPILEDERAQVGIGTMIVFIATVLVAAIAAGVLISTSADLQEKSSRTGAEATAQVASNIRVESIVGTRATANDDLQALQVFISLAPGAPQLDLSEMQIRISDGTVQAMLSHSATGTADVDEFAAVEIRDADGSFTDNTNPVMTAGDFVRIDIDADAALTSEIANRADIDLTFIPEVGSSVTSGFTAPTTYGSRLVIEIS